MIENALLQIREDMARLRAKMKAKGHDRASAEFWIERSLEMKIGLRTGEIGNDGERAFITSYKSRFPYAFIAGTNYAEMLSEAESEIERMDQSIALACASWFEPNEAA